jgi:hypothetical protein
MKVYYAHAESLFGSPTESRDLETLGKFGFNVVDPSWPDIQQKVSFMRSDGTPEDEIQKFLNRYIDECEALVFRAADGSTLPDDVSQAVNYAAGTGKPILQIPVQY